MSITTDIKNYVDQTVAQLNDVNETVTDAVNDLRASAEKAINADALRTAVEPYLAQAREYGTSVTDRAEDLFNGVKDDPRLAKVVGTANAVSAIVIEQVNTYVVKPVQSFTGFGTKPAASTRTAPKPAKAATTKPATRRPSATSTKSSTAKASTARTSTAKTAQAPAKSSAKTSGARKSSATKSSGTKA